MNAFEVLLRGTQQQSQSQSGAGKKRRKSSDPPPLSSQPGSAVRTYVTCPVCRRTIPSRFVDVHVESCLESSSPPITQPEGSSQQAPGTRAQPPAPPRMGRQGQGQALQDSVGGAEGAGQAQYHHGRESMLGAGAKVQPSSQQDVGPRRQLGCRGEGQVQPLSGDDDSRGKPSNIGSMQGVRDGQLGLGRNEGAPSSRSGLPEGSCLARGVGVGGAGGTICEGQGFVGPGGARQRGGVGGEEQGPQGMARGEAGGHLVGGRDEGEECAHEPSGEDCEEGEGDDDTEERQSPYLAAPRGHSQPGDTSCGHPGIAAPPGFGLNEGAKGAKDAFRVLMAGQRQRSLHGGQVFFLEWLGDDGRRVGERGTQGAWRWYWRDQQGGKAGGRDGRVEGEQGGDGSDDQGDGDGAGSGRQGAASTQGWTDASLQNLQQPSVASQYQEQQQQPGQRYSGPTQGSSHDAADAPRQPRHAPLPRAAWSGTTAMSVARGTPACNLLLQTNLPPCDGGTVSADDMSLRSNVDAPPEGRWRGGVPALKSALQKNVRLCRAPCAVRCALQLMKEDMGELLRRLCIICLEDAILHPSLPLLTWFMAAHAKGYALGRTAASELLRITYQLASVRVRDYLPPPNMLPAAPPPLPLLPGPVPPP